MNADACRYTRLQINVMRVCGCSTHTLHTPLVRDGVLGSTWDESKLCVLVECDVYGALYIHTINYVSYPAFEPDTHAVSRSRTARTAGLVVILLAGNRISSWER